MRIINYLRVATIVLALVLAGGALWQADAGKPDWAGDKSEKNQKNIYKDKTKGKNVGTGGGAVVNIYFTENHRHVIREYYRKEYSSGHCPPGLAKKNNGCMPPGQARKWRIGYPLPGDVVIYDVPGSVLVQLGRPPEGHRFVRVASDILLIAIGTGMVIDAIEDLRQM